MEARIAFLGEQLLKADQIIPVPFDSTATLLDGDILVVFPTIEPYLRNQSHHFQGKICLDDDTSFKLRESVEHWKTELNAALVEGKTVIVFLCSMPVISVATGQKEFSGTGRNQKVTRIVTDFEPYSFLPSGLGTFVRREGERIKTADVLGPLSTYWKEFGTDAKFEVYLDSFKGTSLLKTQTGERTVGGFVRYKNLKGTLVLLPPPDLTELIEKRAQLLLAKQAPQKKRSGDEAKDSAAAARRTKDIRSRADSLVCTSFLTSIVEIDKAVKRSLEKTPTPSWVNEETFVVPGEKDLMEQIASEEARMASLLAAQEQKRTELMRVRRLKDLLFEKGKPLERAILIALRALGFTADNLKQADSEFDVVMLSPEGDRYIGEAEGRDDKAVSVDKLDQLDRNLREDFSRQDESTARYATGVLFANSFRLTPVQERSNFFTPKCLLAAERSKIALVRTVDLFYVAKYLLENNDMEFASRCRAAIASAQGAVVVFPEIGGK